MKRIIHSIGLFIICVIYAFGQTPQKFNYQAVVRDDVGNIVEDQAVSIKISILQGSVGGTVVYSETHSPTTNSYGLVTLAIGGGTTSDDFAVIDWGSNTYFMKVEMDATGGTTYSEIGTSQLLSVPYALNAESVNDLKKLDIVGDASAPVDSALFEVKRSDGQTVFAVYNEGVRVYVDDSESKGTKGGFAIGGFSPTTKGITNEYLRVTPDSVRVYVNDDDVKGTKGGFAIGGFTPGKGETGEYFRVTPDSVRIYLDTTNTKDSEGGFAIGGFTPGKGFDQYYFNISTQNEATVINPSQPRILWYPFKEAFLAGRVLIESPDSVGTNSVATGFESKAIGDFSQALGYKSRAYGDYSTAIGRNSQATGNSSFAFGYSTIASGSSSLALGDNAKAIYPNSFAFGSGAEARSSQSLALGYSTIADGQYATSMGFGTISKGIGSTASGHLTQANSNYSFAAGDQSTTNDATDTYVNYPNFYTGLGATAIGYRSEARGAGALALGYMNKATAPFSAAVGGYQCTANEWGSSAIGDNCDAYGKHSIAMGYKAETYGNGSIAIGNGPIAQGSYSYAIGSGVKTLSYASVSMGIGTIANGSYLSVFGISNDTIPNLSQTSEWIETDPLFMVGNGSAGVRSTALTILKNGNTGIGTMSPQGTLDVNGSIYQRGSALHADYVFENEFKLESIEDHSRYMWKNKHLSAVPKAIKDDNGNEVVEWGARSRGILEELEKAHVYIDQLNSTMKEQQKQIENQQQKIDELTDLVNKILQE